MGYHRAAVALGRRTPRTPVISQRADVEMDPPTMSFEADGAAPADRPRVFVETSTIKFATNSRTILRPRHKTVELGGQKLSWVEHDIVEINPNDRLGDQAFRAEVDLLPKVAELAKVGRIELLSHLEVFDELMDITLVGRHRNVLLEAPRRMVESPLVYSRALLGRERRVAFLGRIRHTRFLELRKACGANQGGGVNENQLVDAFHFWCAEHGGATHFLTCDLKLTRLLRNNRRFRSTVRPVSPSELVEEIAGRAP